MSNISSFSSNKKYFYLILEKEIECNSSEIVDLLVVFMNINYQVCEKCIDYYNTARSPSCLLLSLLTLLIIDPRWAGTVNTEFQ